MDILTTTIQYKINKQITARELRIIDETGKNLGILSLEEAFRLAETKGFDLIEITSSVTPPVARIMNFDKFRYQKEKEEKKQKHGERKKELKQVRITPRAAMNDLLVKAKKAEEFLEEGYKVEINLFLRGREKANKEWSLQKLNGFLQIIKTPYKVTMEAKKGGKGYVTQISKK